MRRALSGRLLTGGPLEILGTDAAAAQADGLSSAPEQTMGASSDAHADHVQRADLRRPAGANCACQSRRLQSLAVCQKTLSRLLRQSSSCNLSRTPSEALAAGHFRDRA